MVSGEPFMPMVYSVGPILATPEGRMRFCALTALTMSSGDRPLDSSASVSMSTDTMRCLPP